MDLCWQILSLLLNMLSRLVITFLPRSKSLLISQPENQVSIKTGNQSSLVKECMAVQLTKPKVQVLGKQNKTKKHTFREEFKQKRCGLRNEEKQPPLSDCPLKLKRQTQGGTESLSSEQSNNMEELAEPKAEIRCILQGHSESA